MIFEVNFRDDGHFLDARFFENYNNNHFQIRLKIPQIAELIHEICDDLDMVRPQDMEILKEAIDRFNYLTKVED